LSCRTIEEKYGILTPENVEQNINADDPHFPRTRVLSIENTVNRGGGAVYSLAQIEELSLVCKKNNLKFHLDGARIFNALVASGENAKDYGKYFDTISVCLSKGLGCPIGSVLLSSHQLIKKAKRIRKLMGGGMRQAGFLAAAGIYALDNHVARLQEDHDLAKKIALGLEKFAWVTDIFPVKTNILIFDVSDKALADKFQTYLLENHIKISRVDTARFRIVTHLDCPSHADEILLKYCQNFESK